MIETFQEGIYKVGNKQFGILEIGRATHVFCFCEGGDAFSYDNAVNRVFKINLPLERFRIDDILSKGIVSYKELENGELNYLGGADRVVHLFRSYTIVKDISLSLNSQRQIEEKTEVVDYNSNKQKRADAVSDLENIVNNREAREDFRDRLYSFGCRALPVLYWLAIAGFGGVIAGFIFSEYKNK